MKKIDTLIIGAGISGLSYANFCNEDYLIVEKESTPGGLCRTFYQDGFVWDYAGHFFHFARPEIKELFENEVQQEDMVKCVKCTDINCNGIKVDYPFQMNIHQLPKDEFIDCLYDLFHRDEKGKYTSFEDMLYGKFGKSITEKFLKPYNEKLYACDLNELDTDAMGRFFPYANPEQIINNMKSASVQTYNSTFDYPKLGAQFFVNILTEKIEKDRVLFNSSVESLDLENKSTLINGEEYRFDKLINTMPLNRFVDLLPDEYVGDVGESLTCNKVLVFNLGFDKPAIDKNVHWSYIPMKDVNFYRCGFYNNILGNEKLSMYIEIGYKENEFINVDEQLGLTLENLRKLKIISNHKLLSYNSVVINPGYVHITETSNKKVKELINKLSKKDIYTIGRYGRWTYCSIEDCMVDAMKLARKDYEK